MVSEDPLGSEQGRAWILGRPGLDLGPRPDRLVPFVISPFGRISRTHLMQQASLVAVVVAVSGGLEQRFVPEYDLRYLGLGLAMTTLALITRRWHGTLNPRSTLVITAGLSCVLEVRCIAHPPHAILSLPVGALVLLAVIAATAISDLRYVGALDEEFWEASLKLRIIRSVASALAVIALAPYLVLGAWWAWLVAAVASAWMAVLALQIPRVRRNPAFTVDREALWSTEPRDYRSALAHASVALVTCSALVWLLDRSTAWILAAVVACQAGWVLGMLGHREGPRSSTYQLSAALTSVAAIVALQRQAWYLLVAAILIGAALGSAHRLDAASPYLPLSFEGTVRRQVATLGAVLVGSALSGPGAALGCGAIAVATVAITCSGRSAAEILDRVDGHVRRLIEER